MTDFKWFSPGGLNRLSRVNGLAAACAMAMLVGACSDNSQLPLDNQAQIPHTTDDVSAVDKTVAEIHDLKLLQQYPFSATDAGFEVWNPMHQLWVRFAENGMTVTTPDQPWTATYQLAAVGRKGNMAGQHPTVAPEMDGDRLIYKRGNVTEWYLNTVQGVDQGFDIAERPEGNGPLYVEGAMLTDLQTKNKDDYKTIGFYHQAKLQFTISALVVRDANGKLLQTSMAVMDNQLIRYTVMDADAVYPLSIDPATGSCPSSWCSDGDSSTVDVCNDNGATCTRSFDASYDGTPCVWGEFCCSDGQYHADCSDPTIATGQDCPNDWCNDGDPGTDDVCSDYQVNGGTFTCTRTFDDSLEGAPCVYGANCCDDGQYHADCGAVAGAGQDCPDGWCNDGDPTSTDSCGNYVPATGAKECTYTFNAALDGTSCTYGLYCCGDGIVAEDCTGGGDATDTTDGGGDTTDGGGAGDTTDGGGDTTGTDGGGATVSCPSDEGNTTDNDSDGVCDQDDVCPTEGDPTDSDGDGVCDGVDACPGFTDGLMQDDDNDGLCDILDPCDGDNASTGEVGGDDDDDGICNEADTCSGSSNADSDGDGICDSEDVCEGHDDGLFDEDNDGLLDGSHDDDNDSVCDLNDLCTGNDSLGDADADGVCDDAAIDTCSGASGIDTDNDSVCDENDLCVGNDARGDSDSDGNCDGNDLCPGVDDALVAVGAADTDLDGVIDACDKCSLVDYPSAGNDSAADFDAGDDDLDGVANSCDICIGVNDALQLDADGDMVCDLLDVCPGFPDGNDTDGDGTPSGCDVCPTDNDTDGDDICDAVDVCNGENETALTGDDALDNDSDLELNACDVCPNDNPNDVDADGICGPGANGNDSGTDTCSTGNNDVDADLDGVCDDDDLCPGYEDSLVDVDGDGDIDENDADNDSVCDPADVCTGDDATGDADGDGVCDDLDVCTGASETDNDSDGICDEEDFCEGTADNATGAGDNDNDGICNDLDTCVLDPNNDIDNDTFCDSDENGDGVVDDHCPNDPNNDLDGNGICDDIEGCSGDPSLDNDSDGTCDADDLCAGFSETDADGDGTPNGCDTCPLDPAKLTPGLCGCGLVDIAGC